MGEVKHTPGPAMSDNALETCENPAAFLVGQITAQFLYGEPSLDEIRQSLLQYWRLSLERDKRYGWDTTYAERTIARLEGKP